LLPSFPFVIRMMIFIWLWQWKVSFCNRFTAGRPIIVPIECKSTWRHILADQIYHFWALASAWACLSPPQTPSIMYRLVVG
jgi:hypothetical protein